MSVSEALPAHEWLGGFKGVLAHCPSQAHMVWRLGRADYRVGELSEG